MDKLYNISKFIFLVGLILSLFACGSGDSSSNIIEPETLPSPVTPSDPLPTPDSSPDDFTIESQQNVLLETMVESEGITITGIDTDTTISVDSGEYAIDGGAYNSGDGVVTNGQVVSLRVMSSGEYASPVSLTLSVGDKSREFIVTTASSFITELRKFSGTELVLGASLVAYSECLNCVTENTVYEWFRDDDEAPVSSGAIYEVTEADLLSRITLKATPFSGENLAGRAESITYIRKRVKSITGNQSAFAAVFTDGSVEAWGRPYNGGDASQVQSELFDVEKIFHAEGSFAALRADGSVVRWGQGENGVASNAPSNIKSITNSIHDDFLVVTEDGKVVSLDGDVRQTSEALGSIDKIFPGDSAFSSAYAVVNQDGKVGQLGHTTSVGNRVEIPESQGEVVSVTTNYAAFAAIQSNGEVFSWGQDFWGADSSSVEDSLVNVVDIKSTYRTFTALKGDGTLVTWGQPNRVDVAFEEVAQSLDNTISVESTEYSYAAVTADGEVVAWGYELYGGRLTAAVEELTNVASVTSNNAAFAAKTSTGQVFTWGEAVNGGDSASVSDALVNIDKLYTTETAFAALRNDGSVILWGEEDSGGQSRDVTQHLTDVVSIKTTARAFAALRSDDTVVTWGRSVEGGSGSTVTDSLISDVSKLYSSNSAFAAIKNDGTVWVWGGLGEGYVGSFGSSADPVIHIATAGDKFAVLTESGAVFYWTNFDSRYSNVEGWYTGLEGNGSGLFAAINGDDGSVSLLGDLRFTGDTSSLDGLVNVQTIVPFYNSFIAIKDDGTTEQWGVITDAYLRVVDSLIDVQEIKPSTLGFAALKADNTVISSWELLGVPYEREEEDVQSVFSNQYSFAAIKNDGTVVTWGDERWGGDSQLVQDQLVDIVSVSASSKSFCALTATGTVITWGSQGHGAGEKDFTNGLSGVEEVVGSDAGFAARMMDGTVVTWGDTVSLSAPDFAQEDVVVDSTF